MSVTEFSLIPNLWLLPSQNDSCFGNEFLVLPGIPLVCKAIFVLFFSMYTMVLCKLYHREQGMIKNICGSSLNIEIIIIGLI